MHEAVRAGDVGELIELDRQGVNVNAVDHEHKFTPLLWAVHTGSLECLHWLFWHGADISYRTSKGWTASHVAAIRGQQACMQVLIENGVDLTIKDDRGCTPVHLVLPMAKPTHCRQFYTAEWSDVNNTDNNGWSPMHYAAFHGRLGCIQTLIKWGANVDDVDLDGNTPAHLAAAEGHLLCFKFLILKGLSLAHKLQARNNHGETPRDLAQRFNKESILQHIGALQNQMDILQEPDRYLPSALMNPAHMAAFRGNLDNLRILVESGVININERDEEGSTPMHKAAGQGHLHCLQWLLKMGAAHNLKNNAGETPKDTAKRFAQLGAVKMLSGGGSEVDSEEEVKNSVTDSTNSGTEGEAGKERACQKIEELRHLLEIAKSNYQQLGGVLENTSTEAQETERVRQNLELQLEFERVRREKLEGQMNDYRAEIKCLNQSLKALRATADEKPQDTSKKEPKKSKRSDVGGVFGRGI